MQLILHDWDPDKDWNISLFGDIDPNDVEKIFKWLGRAIEKLDDIDEYMPTDIALPQIFEHYLQQNMDGLKDQHNIFHRIHVWWTCCEYKINKNMIYI